MRKIYLSFLSVGLTLAANAQFTPSTEPTIGESKLMYVCDTAFTDYASTKGNGVTWDYSMMAKRGDLNRTISVKTPSSVSDKFPSSSKAIEIEGFATNFVNGTNSTYNSKGYLFTQPAPVGQITVIMDNSNDELLMNYPYDFSSTHNDTYLAEATALGNKFTCTGVGKFEIDGKGTLKLNSTTTHTDVLRYKLIDTIRGVANVFGQNVNLQIVRIQYEYYNLNTSKLPLFVYSTLKMKAPPILNSELTTKLILNSAQPEYTVGIADQNTPIVTAYPNPTSDQLTIQGAINSNYALYSLDGKMILSGVTTSDSETLSIAQLESGMYTLLINNQHIQLFKQ